MDIPRNDAYSDYAVFLALGSNLGDKQKNIEDAFDKIEERIGRITSLSALHITNPVGFQSANIFVNCVCEVTTNIDIFTLFSTTQEIEKEIGRTSKSHYGVYSDRMIDIDVVMAGDLIVKTPDLTIPHPLFHLRDFVLAPFCEIAPDRIHPLFGKTILQLKEELDRMQTAY
ncbi:MAG: 2-amino-4-hydroxy-6-hydroxymethyldihydropteridine diphosphokinase [Proteiniphilum sp.]|jgi:2-amino-4-hydroxy-6-hydroxymethyldihydropteridine diphosphokinase|nr:2-amino-4-hydroxy-6-hydroxymethyldihydropteridine diphosphokinase [Proteiniphilum sp.]